MDNFVVFLPVIVLHCMLVMQLKLSSALFVLGLLFYTYSFWIDAFSTFFAAMSIYGLLVLQLKPIGVTAAVLLGLFFYLYFVLPNDSANHAVGF